MQISTVSYKDIDLEDRIDAEYFGPDFLNVEAMLKAKNSMHLSDYAKITASAFYPAATELYENGDLPFIRCVDSIDEPVISDLQADSFARIPTSFAEEYSNVKRLKEGEIVMTKVGSPCFASIIEGLDSVALSRTVAGLRSIEGIDPYFLTAFLRSKYGFNQLLRERELTIQYQLTLDRIGRTYIYKPKNPSFEQLIAKLFRESNRLKRESIILYRKAEETLLAKLGASNSQKKHVVSFVRHYSDVEESGRFDAEYFQPVYEHITKAIERAPGKADILGNIISIEKGIEPGSELYQESGIGFLRVSNLSRFGISKNNQQHLTESFYEEHADLQPKQGEILLTKDGTPGIAYYLDAKPEKMLPSAAVLRLRIKVENVLPEYLTLVLNSSLIQRQIQRDSGGSILNHWLIDQIKSTKIPILLKGEQKELATQLAKSFAALEKSRFLFERVSKSIDLAIEKNELLAHEYLEEGFNKYARL